LLDGRNSSSSIHRKRLAFARDESSQGGTGEPMKIAILDDYQNVALKMADWATLSGRAEITTLRIHRILFRDFCRLTLLA